MKYGILIALIALIGAAEAHASGADYGNAGLQALQQGSYDEAIRFFTKAIRLSHLTGDDLELAYLSRGKAYAAKGERKLAATDLRHALRLKPDDQAARAALQLAVSDATPPSVGAAALTAPKVAWGPLAKLADRYWLEVGSKPDYYLYHQWRTPGRDLSFSGMDRRGNSMTGDYTLDEANARIVMVGSYKGVTTSYAVEISGNDYSQTGQLDGQTLRETYSASSPSAYQFSSERFENGAWSPVRTGKYVAVSAEMVQALNWKAGSGGSGSAFLNSLGAALMQGALAGIQSGLQGSGSQTPQ